MATFIWQSNFARSLVSSHVQTHLAGVYQLVYFWKSLTLYCTDWIQPCCPTLEWPNVSTNTPFPFQKNRFSIRLFPPLPRILSFIFFLSPSIFDVLASPSHDLPSISINPLALIFHRPCLQIDAVMKCQSASCQSAWRLAYSSLRHGTLLAPTSSFSRAHALGEGVWRCQLNQR